MNKEIIQTLDKILPVVERVHGDHHPELHRVAQLRNAPGAELFAQLREASGNYAVPADACPTYEKTYRLLEELENEFSA
ncbi:MAG: hypothetical protein Q4E20_01570 [Eubacteriales bacterium]|nr:hypothetical protein [Eubacteriales bacterium]